MAMTNDIILDTHSEVVDMARAIARDYMHATYSACHLLRAVLHKDMGLVVDLSAAVLTTAYLNFGHDRDYVFCVDTSFRVEGTTEPLRGHFLLLPDMPSLRAIFDAIRLP